MTSAILTLSEPLPVLSKIDFVRRYEASEFGNHAPTWNTLEEYLLTGYRGLVHLRNRVAGGPTLYNVPHDRVPDALARLVSDFKLSPESIYFSGMAPTDRTLFQGEVERSYRGLSLYYTDVKRPMRDALKEKSTQVYGVRALALIQFYLCSNSYAWLEHLLDAYPDHVIEFSTYGVNWGTHRGYNTIFWEVRKY